MEQDYSDSDRSRRSVHEMEIDMNTEGNFILISISCIIDMFDYLELNQCLCLSIIILTCSDSFVDSGPDFHDSDQDSDGSEKSASGRFVVFLESGDSDADSDIESHEMASSALSDNSGELPGSELDSDELGDTFTL